MVTSIARTPEPIVGQDRNRERTRAGTADQFRDRQHGKSVPRMFDGRWRIHSRSRPAERTPPSAFSPLGLDDALALSRCDDRDRPGVAEFQAERIRGGCYGRLSALLVAPISGPLPRCAPTLPPQHRGCRAERLLGSGQSGSSGQAIVGVGCRRRLVRLRSGGALRGDQGAKAIAREMRASGRARQGESPRDHIPSETAHLHTGKN
jgi:hypothetical protein